jgi:hypothetical protein
MLPRLNRRLLFALLLVLLTAGVHHKVWAQAAPDREVARRVPVTVVLADSFPYTGAAAVIMRRTSEHPRDVIVLPASAGNGARLAAATMHLLIIRDRGGDTASAPGLFRVPEAAANSRLVQRDIGTAGAVVGRLRTRARESIPGVGRVRATEIYLPSRAMRDTLRSKGRLRVGS